MYHKNRYHDVSLQLVKALIVLLAALPFTACWYFYYSKFVYLQPFYRRGNWVIIAIFLLIYIACARTYDAFYISFMPVGEMIYSQGLAAFVSDAIMYFVMWVLIRHVPNLLPLFYALLGQILLAALWSTFSNRWYFRHFANQKTAVVYDEKADRIELIEEAGMGRKFDVRKTISVDECLQHNCSDLEGVETVFLVDLHSHARNQLLKYCVERDITCFIQPRIGDVILSGARQMHMLHLPILRVDRYKPSNIYVFVKRFFDILLSCLGVVILSPLILGVAIAVKAYDGGPVFYRQCRLTKNGKKFDVLKFRSMRTDAEKDGVARLSSGGKDSRITPVGKVIRRVRLDELPQLFNIIKGDMSIVGPRPERPEIAAQYEEELPEFSLRLQAKAGLTGYAQVYGKYNTNPYDKLEMDLLYIAHPSILEDIRIILATIKILFIPDSTEGIEEGKTTAGGSYEKIPPMRKFTEDEKDDEDER